MSKQSEKSIQELMSQLDKLVAWFNQDDIDIEEALVKYEETVKLADTIKNRLTDVDNKITVLKKRFETEG